MAVILSKGQKLSLSKKKNLKKVRLELGWKQAPESIRTSNIEYDLDASVFLLDHREICKKDEDFIFYNNLVSQCGSVKHTGDQKTGSEDGGECEAIEIDLRLIPDYVTKISAVVTIFDEKGLGLVFDQIEKSWIRVLDAETNELLGAHDLSVQATGSNAIIFGSVVKTGTNWDFVVDAEEYNTGLEGLCRKFNLDVR